jgi:transcriptional regulator GlxA family with amidase domain
VLAESGLLDGHEATTTWWLGPLFRQRYPDIRLDESRMLVASGRFVTAGAAVGHLDLALWLVRQASPELAALVARYLLVDARPSQAQYMIPDHLAHSDVLVQRFERWARGRLADGFSLDAAADALATSKRTLQRRIESVLGKTPLSYFQDLRVERALHLLRTSPRADVDAIAAQVGYADGVTLRALLRRRLGRGVRELRG